MKTITVQLLQWFASFHLTGNERQEDRSTHDSKPLNLIRDHWTREKRLPLENACVHCWHGTLKNHEQKERHIEGEKENVTKNLKQKNLTWIRARQWCSASPSIRSSIMRLMMFPASAAVSPRRLRSASITAIRALHFISSNRSTNSAKQGRFDGSVYISIHTYTHNDRVQLRANTAIIHIINGWLTQLMIYIPPDTKYFMLEMFFPANLQV